MTIFLLILGLVLFVGLVIIHEIGHFVAARRNNVEVEEFGLGFPPRAKILTKKNGTIYSLNWLPLGGFVKLKGEHDADTEPGTYGAAPLGVKMKILLAGVAMNLVVAFVMLTALAWVGMPQIIENQYTVQNDTRVIEDKVLVGRVEEGSPAEKAGLKLGDELLSISGSGITTEIDSAQTFADSTDDFANGTAIFAVRRPDGATKALEVDVRSQQEVEASIAANEPRGYIGVGPTEYTLQRSSWSAPLVAGGLMWQFTSETFKGLGSAIAHLAQGQGSEAGEQVAGPLGIFVLLRDGTVLGIEFVLMIIAIISLTLAIMNVLPIPALDGGRVFLTLLFRAIKKPLTPQREESVVGAGFLFLMILFVIITVRDVQRFF